jgi:hypothetical protein
MPDDHVVAEPTVFLLFGATGDRAHRMVLPAFFRLAQAGLLPSDSRLVGNGRGDVSHENFQERVRHRLEEFGPKPSEGPWDEFGSRLRFAGGRVRSIQPRKPPRGLGRSREGARGYPPARPLLRRAPVLVYEADRGHRPVRPGAELAGGLRKAVRDVV